MAASTKAPEQFGRFISFCLQARGAEALALAKGIRTSSLPKKHQKVVEGFLERFSAAEPKGRPATSRVGELIAIYERYWHAVLLKPKKPEEAEANLRAALQSWLHENDSNASRSPSLDKICDRVKREVERLGYYCITGRVDPLQELEIWKKEATKVYWVRLPEGSARVETKMLSSFLCKGWMAYATLGLYYPGGWAKKNALYCNTTAYDLGSEKFRVSYLGHEAQHFSDYRRFPKLGQADLEYRAKLAEFYLGKRTLKAMAKVYASRADNNPQSPHAFANFHVIGDLAKELIGDGDTSALLAALKNLPGKDINAAAARLIRRHSEALEKLGAKRAKSLIG